MTPLNPLCGLEVRADPHLRDDAVAVRFGGGPVLVTPALLARIRAAGPGELEGVLRDVKLRQLPPLPTPYDLVRAPLYAADRPHGWTPATDGDPT